ncbi:site-specific integrase [Moritella sp. Urea-trap-13]|uniref:site-specific integrase n=1 Tax=Moritella sp. Urea-trap-13 TaxID=2058327 RepID=UPI0012FF2CB9|nr:site-specific integrase [Moritella sp. Urea-trap-13]
MTRPTTNRNGTYQTRIGVPANLRDTIGKSELKRSLGTKSESEAKLKHPIVLAEFETILEQARRSLETESKLTDAVIKNIIFAWRKDVATSFSSQSDAINPYIFECGGLIEGNCIPITSLLEDIDRLKPTSPRLESKYAQLDSILRSFFNNQLDKYQIVANPSSLQYRKLLNDFAFAYIKMTSSALKKKTSDIDLIHQGATLHYASTKEVNHSGETFSDVWNEFKTAITRREPDKADIRLRDYSSAANKFIKMYPNKAFALLTKADIAQFRNVLEQLPTRPKADIAKLSLTEQIAKVSELNLNTTSQSSTRKQINTISAVFTYAIQQGKVQSNPVIGTVSDIKKSKQSNDEKGYSPEEIATIFASKLFQDNYKPARSDYGKAHYWLPLILHYTGARAEEIAQLYVADIDLNHGIQHFRLHDERHDQSIKTGIARKVPIHQHLLDLGLIDYISSLPSDGRLFPKLTAGSIKKYHRGVGKWFAKFVREELGINRAGLQPLHGLRHAFITSCRERDVRYDVQKAITGHSQTDVASQYGRYPLSMMNSIIQGMPKCM